MITLTYPRLLWILAPALAYLYLVARKGYVDVPAWRRRLSLLLRSVMLACLVVAVCLPYVRRSSDAENILFVLDVSESVSTENKETALRRMEEIVRKADARSRFALLIFARECELLVPWKGKEFGLPPEARRQVLYAAEVEQLRRRARELEPHPTDENIEAVRKADEAIRKIGDWKKSFGTEETDLEHALQFSRAVFPVEGQKRIVLFSDGNENLGRCRKGTPALRNECIGVFTHLFRMRDRPEVMLTGIDVPSAVRVKEPFDLEVHVQSTVGADVTVTLFLDDYRHRARKMKVEPGGGVVTFKRISLEGGLHKFEAVAEPDDPALDTLAHNNRVSGFTSVRGKPKVLYIHGDEPDDEMQSHWIRDALEEEGITFGEDGVRPTSGIPEYLEGLLNFDIVLFENVPATRMSRAQMQQLKSYVQNFGGGFVMIGGEESFGLGGYYRTPVEDILPVRMPVEKNLERTNVAVVAVIDKSGSMSGAKIQLAKESAIATAEVLQPMDKIGVVAFDHEARWIVDVTSAADIDRISRGIASLEAGGGTRIYPGMAMAGDALDDVSAQNKLTIVLSDGITQGSGYQGLASRMAAGGITVSTVGIGGDADRRLLTDIASAGGGKFYFTTDFYSLPRIFTKETMRVSKTMLIEEPIQPVVDESDQAIHGIDEFPLVQGYVATTPKAGAKIILVSDEYGDPILAKWRYGLGMTAAFTSSTHSKWVPDWQNSDEWPYFTKFWGQLVRSVMSVGTHKKLGLEVRSAVRRRRATLTLDAYRTDGSFANDLRKECRLFAPGASSGASGEAHPCRHVAPGRYEVAFDLESFGDFHRLLFDQPHYELRRVFAFNQPYSDEYRQLTERPEVLRALAEETGGRAEAPDEELLGFPPPPRHSQPVWHWFVIAALLLLPLDILSKRVLSF